MVPEGIRQMIDAGISLCRGCADSSDPEQQLHPACARTEPAHPQPIPVVSGMVPEQCQPSEEGLGGSAAAASTATDVLHFGFLPLPASLVLKLKASVCELVAVLQDPN